MSKKPDPKTYKAPHPVYVDQTFHPAGEPFVTAAEPGDKWEEIKRPEAAAAEAASKHIHVQPALDKLKRPALEALAVQKNVNPEGLSDKDLITAIKAADEPAL